MKKVASSKPLPEETEAAGLPTLDPKVVDSMIKESGLNEVTLKVSLSRLTSFFRERDPISQERIRALRCRNWEAEGRRGQFSLDAARHAVHGLHGRSLARRESQ